MPADPTDTPDTAARPDLAPGEAVADLTITVHLHTDADDEDEAPEDEPAPLTEADLAIYGALRTQILGWLSDVPQGSVAATCILSALFSLNIVCPTPDGHDDDATLIDLERRLRTVATETLSTRAAGQIKHLIEVTRSIATQLRAVDAAVGRPEAEG